MTAHEPAVINTTYMSAGWSPAERETARNEPTLANPPWERQPDDTNHHPTHACEDCQTAWHDTAKRSRCWSCGKKALVGKLVWGGSRFTSAWAQWEYAGQPSTPPDGCGCSDPTVERVASLIADGLDPWAAASTIYGGAA